MKNRLLSSPSCRSGSSASGFVLVTVLIVLVLLVVLGGGFSFAGDHGADERHGLSRFGFRSRIG